MLPLTIFVKPFGYNTKTGNAMLRRKHGVAGSIAVSADRHAKGERQLAFLPQMRYNCSIHECTRAGLNSRVHGLRYGAAQTMDDSTTATRKVYIYALLDPRTNEPRYIGKTIDLRRRLTDHLACRGKSYRAQWIKSLLRLSLKPLLQVLEETTDELWPGREQWWIAYGHEQGWRLTNGDSGGTGGKVATSETRQKLHVSHLGHKHTSESRQKMSIARKGKTISETHKAALRNRPHTWGDKISAGKMGHDVSDESRAKMSQRKLEHYDRVGRGADVVIEYLTNNPQDAHLSCRQLSRMLNARHSQVSEAKRHLGYPVKQYRYNKRSDK